MRVIKRARAREREVVSYGIQPRAMKGRLLPCFDRYESVIYDIVGSVITSKPRANAYKGMGMGKEGWMGK